MGINISNFFNTCAPMDYSASVAEIGANAGRDTWNAACEDSADNMLLDSEEKREAFRAWVKGYGGWTVEEINTWSDIELNALFIQWISGDMREGNLHADMSVEDWREYETRANAGNCPGNIYGGPLSTDGQIYFSLG